MSNMTMREAIEKTLALHQKVVDGKYRSYSRAKLYQRKGEYFKCPLCNVGSGCKRCPWLVFNGKYCQITEFSNSPASIIRLTSWLAKLDEQEKNDANI